MANPRQGAMEEEFLSCSICYDIFKEPKTLSCLHRFCEECLHNFLLRHKTSAIARQRGFHCPVCREFIRAPDPSRPPVQWAALFKTDFHLKNLIKFVESRPGRRLERPANPCSLHGHAECDLYCTDCDLVICHLCAGISHRGCSRVLTVSEAARDKRAEAGARVKELAAKIKEADDLEKSREKCLDHLDNQKAAAEKAIAGTVKELHTRIKLAEDKLMKRLKDDFESLHGKITVKVVQFENEISEMREKVERFSSNLESISDLEVLKLTSTPDLGRFNVANDIKSYRSFLANVASIKIILDKQHVPTIELGEIIIKGVKEEAKIYTNSSQSSSLSANSLLEPKSLLNRIRSITKRNEGVSVAPRDVNIREDNQLSAPLAHPPLQQKPSRASTLVKHVPTTTYSSADNSSHGAAGGTEEHNDVYPAILTFNNLKMHEERLPENARKRSSLMECNNETEDPGKTAMSTTRVRTINTRFREDHETPKLKDLIVLKGEETVLVTDWANQCVKAMYGRRERDARLVLGGKPWAITQTSENLAAVSLPISTQICVIKVLKCFALDKQGIALFEYPAYVCVTPSAMILVTDRKQGAVTCLTPTGDVKYRFQPDGLRRLKEPCGIVSDCTGRTFVAESRGLLALTPTGQFESALVGPRDSLLEDPRGVALCAGSANGLLYVTSADQNIEVLRVK